MKLNLEIQAKNEERVPKPFKEGIRKELTLIKNCQGSLTKSQILAST